MGQTGNANAPCCYVGVCSKGPGDANAEAASVADELGQGWQSFPACDHMALTKCLERAKASVDASVDRNEAAPLGSFLVEYTGAFGADPT